jgi:hypothetical protein
MSCGVVTLVAYIALTGTDSTLTSKEAEVLNYLLLGEVTLIGLMVLVGIVTLLAYGAIAGDLKKRNVLKAGDVVSKIHRDASAGEYSEDSLFELQRAINAVTKEWKSRN